MLTIVFVLCIVVWQKTAIAQVKKDSSDISLSDTLKTKKDSIHIEIDNSKVILSDTLTFEKDSAGFLKKIIQPLQFKKNRERKEQQRIYEFMMGLVDNGQLNIDTSTVTQIMDELVTIQFDTEKNKKQVDEVIKKNIKDINASEEVIDSLRVHMSAVIQENANNNSKEKRDLLNKVNSHLIEINKVKYSCKSGMSPIDSIMEGDTLRLYYKTCLIPKVKVFGWYTYRFENDEYLNYKFNYLSALNLRGYVLLASGKNKNPDYMKSFAKPGGVIDHAKKDSCDLHLSVYCQSTAIITSFLNNKQSQNIFISELETLIAEHKLKGINLNFEGIKESDGPNYVIFISKLRKVLQPNNIELNITIPAVVNETSYEQIKAYNFERLNPLVDYFLVRTGEMASSGVDLAQSQSPLFNSDQYGNRTIESTIDFYTNRNIPGSKLIVTVSYLGVKWNVKNFAGELKSRKGESISYKSIADNYLNKYVEGRTVDVGFDPDQVSTYLNVIEKNGNTEQIWFEDFMSLHNKYNWVLENELGGVSIWAMGYDGSYPELWKAIGGTLIDIDTVYTDTLSLKVDTLVKLTIKDYLKIFREDLRWAIAVDLKYVGPDSIVQFTYKDIKDEVEVYQDSVIIWYHWQDYKKNTIFQSAKMSYYIFARWKKYANILNWIWIMAVLVIGLLYGTTLYLDRYKHGNEKTRLIIKIGQIIAITLFIPALILWMYLSPSINLIGAASDGSSMKIVYLSLFLGAIIGWFLNSWYNNGKHVKKNLP